MPRLTGFLPDRRSRGEQVAQVALQGGPDDRGELARLQLRGRTRGRLTAAPTTATGAGLELSNPISSETVLIVHGPRYGVDGWPYVVGLTATTVLAGAAAVATRGKARLALSAVAVAAGVPDGLGLRYILGGKLTHRDRLLDRIAWRGDEVVLDAGAGAGLMGVGAARRVPRGRVHCVDLWVGKDLAGSGPDRLHRNAVAEGVADRVRIHTGDVRALHLPDASVDVAFGVLCLHNIPDTAGRAAAARELVRVLRPGGSIVVGDLAGTSDLSRWFAEEGLVIVSHERAPGTFPPQRVLHARKPT